MKHISLSIITLLFIRSSCKKDSAPAGPGQVAFWTDFNLSGNLPDISVTTNGTTGSLTEFTTTQPTCGFGNPFDVTFSLPPGTYGYSAISMNSSSMWRGTYTVTSGGCQLIDLSAASAQTQPNYGTLMFWISEADNNTLTVNINGTSGTITQYYQNNTAPPPRLRQCRILHNIRALGRL